MRQRIVLWGALAVLALGAGGLVVVASGGGGDGPAPRLPLQLSGNSGDAATVVAETAIAPWGGVTYVAGDGLPSLGGDAPAYRLAPPSEGEAEDLVAALGIDADVESTPEGWTADDGEMTFAAYDDAGTWWAHPTGPDATAVPRDGSVSPTTGATAGGGAAGPDVPASAHAEGTAEPPTTVVTAGPDTAVSSGIAEPVAPVVEPTGPTPETTIVCITALCELPDDQAPPTTTAPGPTIPGPTVLSDGGDAGGDGGSPGEDRPGGASSSPAEPGTGNSPGEVTPARPCVPGPATTCPAPEPAGPAPSRPADLPSEDEATQVARDLLAAAGLPLDGAEASARDTGISWLVTIEPRIDGVAAPGMAAAVEVGGGGRVTHASGPLGSPEEVATYPLLTTAEAIERLNDRSERNPYDVTTMIAIEPAEPATGPTDPATGAAEPATGAAEPATGAAEPAPGTAEPAPAPEPSEVELTDAELVLLAVPSWDGSGTYLVPGYRFSGPGGHEPFVPALPEDVLEPPGGAEGDDSDGTGDVPGRGAPEPGGPEPQESTEAPVDGDAGAVEPGAGEAVPSTVGAGDGEAPAGPPGTPVGVTLTHCGFEPLTTHGKRWAVLSPPFDATNAPPEFTGRGTFVVGGDGTAATYTDASGIAVAFAAVDESWRPPPCA